MNTFYRLASCLVIGTAGAFLVAGCAGRAGTNQAAGAQMQHFGAAPTNAAVEQVPVQTVLANADAYNGKLVRISGTVSDVCAAKGCWLTLGNDAASPLFVKFTCPIEDRLIPKEAVGKPAVVEGTVSVVEMSEAEARHYKEDAGATPEEIAKIIGPQRRVTVAAPSASIAQLAAGK